jgi:hypothetical protein
MDDARSTGRATHPPPLWAIIRQTVDYAYILIGKTKN